MANSPGTISARWTRPMAWELLARAIDERCTVRGDYHGHRRLICPHLLGWKNRRALLLAYQVSGSTSDGALSTDPRQRWRWMSVAELQGPVITDDAWMTADNYRPDTTTIDIIEVAVEV